MAYTGLYGETCLRLSGVDLFWKPEGYPLLEKDVNWRALLGSHLSLNTETGHLNMHSCRVPRPKPNRLCYLHGLYTKLSSWDVAAFVKLRITQ